jgi:hypothetical protein
MSTSEPRNPFYLLLLLVSLLFVITALAYAFVPSLESMYFEAGNDLEPSVFRASLRNNGGWWLIYELIAMVFLGLVSMGYDRLRSLQNERKAATIPPAKPGEPTT